MKKLLVVAALAVACLTTALPRASAQSAFFTYTGVPTSPLQLGQSFTIGVTINFTAGGNVANLNGLSYWAAQFSGTGSPFNLTVRDIGTDPATGGNGSIFRDLQTSNFNLNLPQIIDPINRQSSGSQTNTDLGALSGPPVGNGAYFVANLTFQVARAGSGTYTLGNSTNVIPGVGGRISVITDNAGNTAPISNRTFAVSVVPEPSTFALLGIGLVSAGAAAYRRRRSAKA